MLILQRKTNESVWLGDDKGNVIKVMVVEVKGDKVKLGFDAPESMGIWREEVVRAAAEGDPILLPFKNK